jgi:hypothetical protein
VCLEYERGRLQLVFLFGLGKSIIRLVCVIDDDRRNLVWIKMLPNL